jgi:hypothetical protein
MDPALEARIRRRAYQIWEEEGKPTGRDVEHWIRAVLELARDGKVRLLPDGVLQTDDDRTSSNGGRPAERRTRATPE